MAKKTRRSNIKHPMLEKRFNSRVKQEVLDMDYIHKLNNEEKTWLDGFLDEYVNAKFDQDGSDFHSTPEARKECYDANNARNRCLYGRIRNKVGATKLINYDLVRNVVEEELSKEIDPSNIEDAIISFIDYMKEQES